MSNDDKTGGVAFPPAYNLTVRDYFAALAMQAIITAYQDSRDDRAGPVVGKMAYAFADAMLEARKESK